MRLPFVRHTRRNLETQVTLGFGVAVVLLALIGVIASQTMLTLMATRRWESRHNAVLIRLETIAAQLKDIESGRRDYLLTGEAQYLAVHHAAIAQIAQEAHALRLLMRDSPSQQRRLDRFELLLGTLLAGGNSASALWPNSPARLALPEPSQLVIERLRQMIADLKDQEYQLLHARSEQAEGAAQSTIRMIMLGSLLALLLVSMAAVIIRRDIVRRRRSAEALRESEARFRRLAENAADMIYRYRLRPSPRFEYVSPAATALCGYPPAAFYADPELCATLTHPDDRPLVDAISYSASSSAVPLVVRWVHRDGSVVWTSQRLVPVYDAAGGLVAIEGIVRDVTERMQDFQQLERRVEERTHEIERRRQVAEGLRDIVSILNSNRSLDEILDTIVAQACGLLGTDGGAVYRLPSQAEHDLAGDPTAASVPLGWEVVAEALRRREPVAITDMIVALPEVPAGRGDPSRPNRYGALLALPLAVKDEGYGAIILYYHRPRLFTTEEIELASAFGDQAALAIENARLRRQVEQTAIAAERSRLARDLHDAVTQTLFSASLIADVLPRLWERNPDEAQRRLAELRQLTRGALAEMRMLLLELRPATLTEVDLNELLRQLAEAITGRARLPISLSAERPVALPPDVQIAFYRIAQEALNNVSRHAGASQAAVGLRSQSGLVELTVADDGQGFDPADVPQEHLGLRIMRERAEAIDATLRVESRPGSGTQITLSWAWHNANGREETHAREPGSSAARSGGARGAAVQWNGPYSRSDR